MDPLTTLLLAISVMLAGIISAFGKSIERWLKENFLPSKTPKQRIQEALQIMVKGYNCIDDILRIPDVDRVSIFIGHNGGGLPNPTKPFWISSTFTKYANGDRKDNIRELMKADKDFIEMLTRLLEGPLEFDVPSMPETSVKRVFEQEGVKWCCKHLLSIEGPNLVYLGVYANKPLELKDKITIRFKIKTLQDSIQYVSS